MKPTTDMIAAAWEVVHQHWREGKYVGFGPERPCPAFREAIEAAFAKMPSTEDEAFLDVLTVSYAYRDGVALGKEAAQSVLDESRKIITAFSNQLRSAMTIGAEEGHTVNGGEIYVDGLSDIELTPDGSVKLSDAINFLRSTQDLQAVKRSDRIKKSIRDEVIELLDYLQGMDSVMSKDSLRIDATIARLRAGASEEENT